METFEVSFDGPVNGDFSVSGSAQGIALLLTDSKGVHIYPGKNTTERYKSWEIYFELSVKSYFR
ncbi:hypothetical protein J4731_17655 [Providencia rettgeri]|nr:hypothetical protein [Providencia rettgeri]